MQQDELESISLSYLQQFFHLPLNDVATHLNVSLTALKCVCRKQGLPRWPYRQINSIENEISSLQDKCNAKLPLAAGQLASCHAQLRGMLLKKELIVRSAVLGVDPIVRNAIYLTDVSGVDEKELFDRTLLPRLVSALKTVKKRKMIRGFFLRDIVAAVRRSRTMPDEITDVSSSHDAVSAVASKSGTARRNSGREYCGSGSGDFRQLPLPPCDGLEERLKRSRGDDTRQRGRRGRGRQGNSSSEEEDDGEEDGFATSRAVPTGSSEELLLHINGSYEEAKLKHAEEVFRKITCRSSLRGTKAAMPHIHWDASNELLASDSPSLKRARRNSCSSSEAGCLSPISRKSAGRGPPPINIGVSPSAANTDSGWTSGASASSFGAFSGDGMPDVDNFNSFETLVAAASAQAQQPQQLYPQHQLLPKRELLHLSASPSQSAGGSWSNPASCDSCTDEVWGETAETAAMFKHTFAANGYGFLWDPNVGDEVAMATAVAAATPLPAVPPPPEGLCSAFSGGIAGLQLMPLTSGDF